MRLHENVEQQSPSYQAPRLAEQAVRSAGDSASNVLVVGGNKVFRETVALAIHRARPVQTGLFTRIDCDGRRDLLRTAFVGILHTLARQASSSHDREAPLLGGGTVFLDPIDCMHEEDQKACLELLKQLQARRNERPGRQSVRVVAGASSDLAKALSEGRILRSLVDILDKVKVVAGEGDSAA